MLNLKYVATFLIGASVGFSISKLVVNNDKNKNPLAAEILTTQALQKTTNFKNDLIREKQITPPQNSQNELIKLAHQPQIDETESLTTYNEQLSSEEAALLNELNTDFYGAFNFQENNSLTTYIEQGLPTAKELNYLSQKSTSEVLTDFEDTLRSGGSLEIMQRIAPLAFTRSIEEFKESYNNFKPEQTIDLDNKSDWPQELTATYKAMSDLSAFNFSSKTATAALAQLKYFEIQNNNKDKYDTSNNPSNNYALWSLVINASGKLRNPDLVKTYEKVNQLTPQEVEIISSLKAGFIY